MSDERNPQLSTLVASIQNLKPGQLQELPVKDLSKLDHSANDLYKSGEYTLIKNIYECCLYHDLPASTRNYPGLVRAMARVALMQGDYETAKEALKPLSALPATEEQYKEYYISARLYLAYIALHENHLERLYQLAKDVAKFAERPAQKAEAQLLLGEYFHAKASSECIAYYTEAVRILDDAIQDASSQPGGEAEARRYEYDYIRAIQRLAEAQLSAGNYLNLRKTLRKLERRLKQQQTGTSQPELVSWAWFHLGEIQQLLGNPREALAYYEKSLSIAPHPSLRHAQIVPQKVRLYLADFQDGQAQAALDSLEPLGESSQDEQIAYMNFLLAKALLRFWRGDYRAAMKAAEEARQINIAEKNGRLYKEARMIQLLTRAVEGQSSPEDLASIQAIQDFFEEQGAVFELAQARIIHAWIQTQTEQDHQAIHDALTRCLQDAEALHSVRHFYRLYKLSQSALASYWRKAIGNLSASRRLLDDHEKTLEVENLQIEIYSFGEDVRFGPIPANPNSKPHQLFAYLLCCKSATVDDILTNVWQGEMDGGSDLKQLKSTFRQNKRLLAKELGRQYISYDPSKKTYGINWELIQFYDAQQFSALCQKSSQAQNLQDRYALQWQAHELYKGEFLPGFRMEIVEETRNDYQRAYQGLLLNMLESAQHLGDPRYEELGATLLASKGKYGDYYP